MPGTEVDTVKVTEPKFQRRVIKGGKRASQLSSPSSSSSDDDGGRDEERKGPDPLDVGEKDVSASTNNGQTEKNVITVVLSFKLLFKINKSTQI